jgi:hypothetical protein
MPALVGENGFQREVIGIGIPRERLGINDQQIRSGVTARPYWAPPV